MLTADTITDEQICKLLVESGYARNLALVALGKERPHHTVAAATKAAARARCAEILSSRAKEVPDADGRHDH